MRRYILRWAAVCLGLVVLGDHGLALSGVQKGDSRKQVKFPPCKACRVYVDSFQRGLLRTDRGKFEGGDAAWEEDRLRTYSKSEVRLVEIQEGLCADVDEGKDQCYQLNEQLDSALEDWWFKERDSNPDLYEFLCVGYAKRCCPTGKFGPECKPCIGYPDKICGGNGRCRGDGTRKGDGRCSCEPGYSGLECAECADGFFEAYKDKDKLLCTQCHSSCEDKCTKAGPTGCEKCTDGYLTDEERGCLDINECATNQSPCHFRQFCVNTEGSFKCLDCDRSCNGCTGDGPDMCVRCAKGYRLKENMCIDSSHENRQQYAYYTRYGTYLGLCVATCIIFQKSVPVAAVIGLAVGVYISLSEYILSTPPTPNATNIAEAIMAAADFH